MQHTVQSMYIAAYLTHIRTYIRCQLGPQSVWWVPHIHPYSTSQPTTQGIRSTTISPNHTYQQHWVDRVDSPFPDWTTWISIGAPRKEQFWVKRTTQWHHVVCWVLWVLWVLGFQRWADNPFIWFLVYLISFSYIRNVVAGQQSEVDFPRFTPQMKHLGKYCPFFLGNWNNVLEYRLWSVLCVLPVWLPDHSLTALTGWS